MGEFKTHMHGFKQGLRCSLTCAIIDIPHTLTHDDPMPSIARASISAVNDSLATKTEKRICQFHLLFSRQFSLTHFHRTHSTMKIINSKFQRKSCFYGRIFHSNSQLKGWKRAERTLWWPKGCRHFHSLFPHRTQIDEGFQRSLWCSWCRCQRADACSSSSWVCSEDQNSSRERSLTLRICCWKTAKSRAELALKLHFHCHQISSLINSSSRNPTRPPITVRRMLSNSSVMYTIDVMVARELKSILQQAYQLSDQKWHKQSPQDGNVYR